MKEKINSKLKMRNTYRFLFPVITLIMVTSCSDGRIYDEVKELKDEEWHVKEYVEFLVNVSDTTQAYDINIHVRNSSDYKYSNLWLFVETSSPNGATMRDTIEFFLADEAGNWYGNGLGSINALLVPYKQNIKFPYRGVYSFSFAQGMRKELLTGIKDIGLQIQKR